MRTWILHNSKFGNGKNLAENMANTLKSYGEVHVGHVKDVNPKEIAQNPPDLLIVGAAVRMFMISPGSKKWINKFTKELKHLNKTVPYGAVFVTHGRTRQAIEGKCQQYRVFMEKKSEIAHVYSDWCSAQVKEQEGPFIEGELEKSTEFVKNVVAWTNTKK